MTNSTNFAANAAMCVASRAGIRWSTTDAVERKRASENEDATDTSKEMPMTQEKRCPVHDLHVACVAGKEVLSEHAQWREPRMRAHKVAAYAPPSEGVGAAISSWAAGQYNSALG